METIFTFEKENKSKLCMKSLEIIQNLKFNFFFRFK
jgi:hypothetical protein